MEDLMRATIILLVAWQLILAQGEIVQTGKQYEPGTRVYFPSYGISFVVPRDWKGGLAAEEAVFFMASDTKPGVGLAIFKSGNSPTDLENYLNAVQNLGDNIVLQPEGKIQIKDSELSANYSSSLYRGKAVAKVGPHGHSVIFFFAGPLAQEKYYPTVTEKISALANFSKPDPDLVIADWHKKLSGLMLQKMDAAADSSKNSEMQKVEFNEIHFCKDGSYHFGGEKMGKWQIEVKGLKAQLILLGAGQNSLVYSLGIAGEGVSLSGTRYKIQKSADCK
jgi:hypothetical protein